MARRGKETSVQLRAIIVALYKAGFTATAISPIISRPRQTVSTIIHRYHTTGTLSSTHPGRRRILDERGVRQLLNGVRKNRFASTRQHLTDLGLNGIIKLNTANKILREEGYPARVARRKPYLNSKHRKKRLVWAKQFQHLTKEDWRRIIFTDESSFETGSSARALVRRKPGEEFKEDCIRPTFKSGRTSSNHWGGIHYYGRSELVCLRGQGRMTMVKYSDIILRGTLPNTIQEAQECHNIARKNLPQENMQVAEDNAPCHTGGVSAKTRKE
jgi:transposase